MDHIGRQLSGEIAVTGLPEPVREDLINGGALGPVGGMEVRGDAADLPQVAGLHIAVVTLLEQPEAAVPGGDIEIVEEQTRMGEGKFAAPDLIGGCGDLLHKGDLLEGGGAVIAFQDADHLPGVYGDGNMDIQRAGFIGNQRTEGLFVHGRFAVIKDSHGSLLS